MHHVDRYDPEALAVPPGYDRHSDRFTRQALLDGSCGSVHMGFGACRLGAGGWIAEHVHSYEESFFVLEGRPRVTIGERTAALAPQQCGVVPVGVAHAWSVPDGEEALWLEMIAPRPRPPGAGPADTFFQGNGRPAPARDAEPVDVRDPRNRHLFRLDEGQMDVDNLKLGSRADAPQVSASMATALLAYSGIAVKMLVDERLDAALHTMFMVEYQPGGVAHPHDHPLEEAYYVLDGEVEAEADGERFTLRPGDFFWTAVGCVHAFHNTSGATVRWLETQAPRPPLRHSYRFNRDWDYLAEQTNGGPR
jgi:quercetin dioxygenase-like cupin family protein